ncbi:MAG: hypothetical protein NT129_06075 [Candidatus Aenigmarchaeota archaeon]|nr:hypothetical protein [Candidatus Aenigmarchaeota archaeon]
MSGEEGPLNLPMSALFALVFAIIGIVLLMTIIFSGLKPYEQIARANADRLASAIDEACFTGHNVDISDFYLPQNTPIFSKESAFAPTLRIRSDGDPKYVLYYEMFPPGEAIGWEVYHDFDYRAVAMLPDNLPADFDMHSFISDVKSFVIEESKDDAEPPKTVDVFIGNLLLSGSIDPTTGEAADAKSITMGKWDGNKFVLSTEFFSSAINKTMPKYLSCGDNALCLKTPSAIYKYELKHCKDKIDYIQLINSPSLFADTNKKGSDFYLASPCKTGSIGIKFDTCTAEFGVWGPGKCDKSIIYPIYKYQGGALVKDGEYAKHIACVSQLQTTGTVDNVLTSDKHNCIRVVLNDEDKFCFTLNPSGGGMMSLGELVVSLFTDKPKPVTYFTKYEKANINGLDADVFVLKPASTKLLESFWTYVGEKFNMAVIWRWPN